MNARSARPKRRRFSKSTKVDEYETYDFELKGEEVAFNPEAAESNSPEVQSDTEVFCEKCSWHDKFQKLKNS